MNTLVDFITQNKGIEYLLAIAFIGGYALFVEFLKPRPFVGFVSSLKEDLSYIRGGGRNDVKRLMRNLLLAPFVAAAYLAALPFYFAVGIGLKAEGALSSVIGGGSMAWRPLEAYLSGRSRKGRRKAHVIKQKEESGDERQDS